MNVWSTVCIVMLASAASAASSATAAAASGGAADPMLWTLDTRVPELRVRMNEAAYAAAKMHALAAIDRAALARSTCPPFGVEVVGVIPGAQAEALGIAPGDVMWSLDGKPLKGHQLWPKVRPGPQTLELWSVGRGRHAVTIAPGRMGFEIRNGWHPDLCYAHLAPPHGGAWDADMAVASTAKDPDLCETALAHARSARCTLWLVDALACDVAMQQGRIEDGLRFGRQALDAMRGEPPLARWHVLDRVVSAAQLLYAFDLVVTLLRTEPVLAGEADQLPLFEHLAAEHRALPVQERVVVDVLTAAPGTPGQVLTDQLTCTPAQDAPLARDLRAGKGIQFRIAADHFLRLAFAPTAPEVELNVDLMHLGPADGKCTYRPQLRFGLDDLEDPSAAQEIVSSQVNMDGTMDVVRAGFPTCTVPFAWPMGWHAVHLHAAVIGRNCELALDGNRFCSMPLASQRQHRQIGFFVEAIGIAARMSAVQWRRLDPQAQPVSPARADPGF